MKVKRRCNGGGKKNKHKRRKCGSPVEVTKQEVKEIARHTDYVDTKNNYDEKLSKKDLMLALFWGCEVFVKI